MNNDPFKEYIKESEPSKRVKRYAWHTAIGLQAVDGLETSEYLAHTAARNIEGEISFGEVSALLQAYYKENPARDARDRTEEADKVSARIAALLSERAFSFTPNEYLSIHKVYLQVFFLTQDASGVTTSQRRNGCLTVRRCCMAAPQSCRQL